jgi:hypothetical protein
MSYGRTRTDGARFSYIVGFHSRAERMQLYPDRSDCNGLVAGGMLAIVLPRRLSALQMKE